MQVENCKLFDVVTKQRMDALFFQGLMQFNNCRSLNTLALIKGGKRMPKGESFSTEETGYLYLRLSDINDYEHINYQNLKYISEELFKRLSRYEVKNNELVISIAGTVGKVFSVSNIPNDKRVILTENCAKIKVNRDDILLEYLKVILQLDFIQNQINKNRIKTTIPKLGLDKIGKIQIPHPPVEKQQEIIDIYNAAIKEKQEKEQEAKTLLESIDAYILNVLNVNFPKPNLQNSSCSKVSMDKLIGKRFDPYYHKPYFEDAFAELGKSYYPIARLKDIAEFITSGITPKSGGDDYTTVNEGVAFIRSGDIDINGEIDFDDLLYIKKEVHNNKMKSSQVRNNDIMIAIVGATIGQVGIYHSDKEANINQAIALVRLKDGYNPEYVKEVIKSSIGQLNLNRLKRPVARANINLEEIASILIPMPNNLEIQNNIANHVLSIREKAKTVQSEGARLLEEAKQRIEQMILK